MIVLHMGKCNQTSTHFFFYRMSLPILGAIFETVNIRLFSKACMFTL